MTVGPEPRRSDWRWFAARPLLAERAALALCRRSAPAVAGTDWRAFTIVMRTDYARSPPLKPYYFATNRRQVPIPGVGRLLGPGRWPNRCPVCAQPTYQRGSFDAADGEPHRLKVWHECCNQAWWWSRPAAQARRLAQRQAGVCPETGDRIIDAEGTPFGDAQVDHVEPLWRVWALGDRYRWPDVLQFWGPRNLQLLSARGHVAKTAREARERAAMGRRRPGKA